MFRKLTVSNVMDPKHQVEVGETVGYHECAQAHGLFSDWIQKQADKAGLNMRYAAMEYCEFLSTLGMIPYSEKGWYNRISVNPNNFYTFLNYKKYGDHKEEIDNLIQTAKLDPSKIDSDIETIEGLILSLKRK